MRALVLLVVALPILALANAKMIFVNEKRNWFDAKNQCYQRYKHMAGPIVGPTDNDHYNDWAWVGGSRLHDLASVSSGWKWEHIDRPIRDFSWVDGRPSNYNNLRYCMAINRRGDMIDMPCSEQLSFYCESKK